MLFITLHPVTSSPALIVLGAVTAITVEKTGRLWPSMIIHAGYNLMVWAIWFAR
jgi:membrane protease YdiL (CAAX protease family)